MGFEPGVLDRISLWTWAALVTGWNEDNRDPDAAPRGFDMTESDRLRARADALAAFGLAEHDVIN